MVNSSNNRIAQVLGHLQSNSNQNALSAEKCAFMDNVQMAPPDMILGVAQAFQADKDPRKVNVSVGAYRTNEGKPYVLKCVLEAEKIIEADKSRNKEYLKQGGDPEFFELAQKLLFGKDTKPVVEGRICTAQSLSGTGALRLGAEFIKRFLPNRTVYYSGPTWGTHKSILAHAGVEGKEYRYWNDSTRGLDIDGMCEDIANSPMGSIILLHAAAHNPTGVDPTKEQWLRIAKVCHQNGSICWFDSAYQGFATGDLDKDAFAIQHFANTGHPILASQSFAKNFGLYGERIGTFNVVCARKEKVAAVKSQLDIIIRNLYSNPPRHGAAIVKTILGTPRLDAMWREELMAMSVRISEMRGALFKELTALKTPGDWSHITSQIGMFSFTGLTKAQCDVMVNKHHIYMLNNGRISMAGVNTGNAAYIAAAMDDVVRNTK